MKNTIKEIFEHYEKLPVIDVHCKRCGKKYQTKQGTMIAAMKICTPCWNKKDIILSLPKTRANDPETS